MPILDPHFYLFAIPAAMLIGLAKGGIGGGVGLLATPLVALAVSPVQAAGILLPILCLTDAVAVWSWRKCVDWTLFKQTLPPAMLGIGIGWATAAYVTSDHIRLIVGVVSITFVLSYWLNATRNLPPAERSTKKAWFWSTISGFTSFVSHTGGPPYQMYVVPLRLNSQVYVATIAYYFAVVNYVKLVPYYFLGQLSVTNLATAAVLLPVAIIATFISIWIVKKLNQENFYRIVYLIVFAIGLKLLYDGITGILA